jgi:hypothetical protein
VVANAPPCAPHRTPARRTAKVWPVIGTGVQGRGIFIWAASPIKAAPTSAMTNFIKMLSSSRQASEFFCSLGVFMGNPSFGENYDLEF